MKTELWEVFDFIESLGWDICTLEENYIISGNEFTVYGISKNLDNDCVAFTAVFSETNRAVKECFEPIAENFVKWISLAWYNAADWEKEEISELLNAVTEFLETENQEVLQ